MVKAYVKKNTVSTENMPAAAAPSFTMPASGMIERADIPAVEVVSDTMEQRGDWAGSMAFLNEPIEIRISSTTNPNDEKFVFACVNGERSHPQYGNYLPRDVELTLKRKVVQNIARAKPIAVTTTQVRDYDGSDTARINQSTGNKYPFEIINPTSRDVEWVKRIRAEA